MKKKTECPDRTEVMKDRTEVMKLLSAALVFLCVMILFSVSEAATVSYRYDDAGRLTAVDYGKGKKISYSYDNNGNLVQRNVTAGYTMQDAISVLQILSHIYPGSTVYAGSDINNDGKTGLAEGSFVLQKISKVRK